jgi:hypothetical protein
MHLNVYHVWEAYGDCRLVLLMDYILTLYFAVSCSHFMNVLLNRTNAERGRVSEIRKLYVNVVLNEYWILCKSFINFREK